MPEIPYSPSSAVDSSPPPPLHLLLAEVFPGASFAAAAGAAFDVVGGGYGDIKRYLQRI